jgi:hypothetical protein
MRNLGSKLDISTEADISGDPETTLRCQISDCQDNREFSTESALRYTVLTQNMIQSLTFVENIKTSTRSHIPVQYLIENTLNSETKVT